MTLDYEVSVWISDKMSGRKKVVTVYRVINGWREVKLIATTEFDIEDGNIEVPSDVMDIVRKILDVLK